MRGPALSWASSLTVSRLDSAWAAVVSTAPANVAAVQERLQVPIIAPDLESREGYQPEFLYLPGGEKLPLPALTVSGKRVAAKLDDGTWEL